jgi:hypothetical protein
MDVTKCRTCKNFDTFFYSCNLYEREVYLGEGEVDFQHVSIRSISKSECEYEQIRL